MDAPKVKAQIINGSGSCRNVFAIVDGMLVTEGTITESEPDLDYAG